VFDKLKDIIPRDEEGKDDGKGGRSLTPGSLIELIGTRVASAKRTPLMSAPRCGTRLWARRPRAQRDTLW